MAAASRGAQTRPDSRWDVKLRGWLAALAATLAGLTAGCGARPGATDVALQSLSGERMLQHIRVLSSDELGGRAPGSRGEELTVQYLQEEFRALGLVPGNPDGTFLQSVPLVGITSDPKMQLTLSGQGRTLRPKYQADYVAQTRRVVESSPLDAEMIFAGYGVQAPEFQWDDFKGMDVKGKAIVVLVNDPPVASAANPAELDAAMFGGNAMTYYGRWTYKFEKAAELGAAACFIIHQTGPAGYGWDVVRNSWSGEQFSLAAPDKNMNRAAVEGWLSLRTAQELFGAAGLDFDKLAAQAKTREFRPVALGMRARITLQNKLREIGSKNVIARIPGGDANLRDSYVVYMAHWDHLGTDPSLPGDQIFNGAVDNASGVAALLEIARAYKQLRTPPRRSILFMATTAEEQGLLGSEYYGEHPLYPLAKTAVDINMDSMNVLGKTADLVMIGKGNSTLDELVESIAREQGRTVKPDAEPEKGYFYRSDHFNFAKQGVPSFDPEPGVDFVGKPAGWGMEMRHRYNEQDYHKPSDEVHEDWDMSGAVQDAQLFFLVGYRVANDPDLPEWKPGTEFKAKREAMLRSGK
jgi:Zn-dependent M28 family amino/carboxypeptidase